MTPLRLTAPVFSEWLPQASSMAPRVERIFDQLLGVSIAMVVLLGVLTLVILVRYRKTWKIEASWIAVTLAVFLYFYAEGAGAYSAMERIPAGIPEINVVGRQWMWDVTYPDGRRDFNTVHVKLNTPVRIVLSSEDVIHSFFVPAFRLKQDLVPGRFVSTWFKPTQTGSFTIYCAQYCGTAHAQMTGTVVVLDDAKYAAWSMGGNGPATSDEIGRRAYVKYGCASCHGAGGTRAPSLAGLYETTVTLADGSKVTADGTYLANAILSAAEFRVAGYRPDMPTYSSTMSRGEAMGLVAFLKTLGPSAPAQPQ
jgi:cytochrome c oxidase subunit II